MPASYSDRLLGLLLATIGAFLAAAYYAHIANRTLSEIQKQTTSVEVAAYAAKKSADIADKTLVATQRPWISVHLDIADGGIKFEEHLGRVSIIFRIKNVGTSPAVGVRIDSKVVPGLIPHSAIAEQETMLAAAQISRLEHTPNYAGYTLFPGEEITEIMTLPVKQEDIKKALTEMKDAGITFYIIGYVVYGFSFNDSVHKTGIFNQVIHFDSNSSNCLIKPKIGVISPSQLKLNNFWSLGGFAD